MKLYTVCSDQIKSPHWFVNFMKHVHKQSFDHHTGRQLHTINVLIDVELAKSNAKYINGSVDENRLPCIEFENEEDATWFLMRWS